MSCMFSCRSMVVLAVATSALLVGAPAIAWPGDGDGMLPVATGVSPATASSPFLGEWELDLTRMPDTYGPPPKKVIYTFADIGSGQWRTTIDITAPDDSVRHMAIQYRRDGRVAQSEGNTYEGEDAAINAPAPDVLVMSISREKRLGSVRTYVISPNGQEMTEAAANVDRTGMPFVRNFYFKRIG